MEYWKIILITVLISLFISVPIEILKNAGYKNLKEYLEKGKKNVNREFNKGIEYFNQ